MPGVGFHAYRHTCASILFAEDRNAVQVQRWLGHHSTAFTLATYVHLLDGDPGSRWQSFRMSAMMRNDYRTSEEGVILDRAMTVPIEYVDAQQFWDEKEEARRADVEALRSGEKTEAQLQRENAIFALPPERIQINLDSARSLS